jgi:hypothetical protein
MLFDTTETPEEQPKKRGRKRPSAVSHSPEPVAERCSDDGALLAILSRPAVVLGRLDSIAECHRCEAACMDIVEEEGREWQIECCFCGLKQWHPAIAGHLKPRDQGFVFNDGRFAGKTVEEAFVLPRGRDYVEWAAKEHKRPSVRDACAKFLLTAAAAVR